MNADQTLVNMPTIGFGTYLIPNEEAQKNISIALKIGYRQVCNRSTCSARFIFYFVVYYIFYSRVYLQLVLA